MEIKIGNFLIIILIFLNILSQEDPKISHKILSSKGILLKNPVVGEPFLLEFSVHDANLITGFNVENLEQFTVRDFRRVTNQSIINGIKTESKNFTYSLVAQNSGKFKLGPITLKADNKIITTDSFEIEVKKRDYNESFSNSSEPQAQLKMFIDNKNKIFVGQKIPLKVRFYYNSDDITCDAVSPISPEDFALYSYSGPYEGYEAIGGQKFKYLEWTYNIFAKKSGNLILPEITSAYNISRSDDMYSTVLRMFGAPLERKIINSNSLNIQVLDVPKFPNFDGAIGKFTSLLLTVTADKFSQASPIILKLKMEGDGNFENMNWPQLKLDNSFRVTESKKYFEESGNKITFEYILQGLEPGDYKVESHEIVYFDPGSEKFEILKSNFLNIKIEPSNVAVDYKDELDKLLEVSEKRPNGSSHDLEISKLNLTILPWETFWSLFFGSLAIFIFIILYLFFKNNYQAILHMFFYNLAFVWAKFKIKYAQKIDRPDEIYNIFDKLFRTRLPNYFKHNAGQDLENVLKFAGQKNIDSEKIKDWNNFYLVVLSYKFSNFKGDYLRDYSKDWVFKKSIYWIKKLEKLI